MSVLHEAAHSATAYLPQRGTLALPLPLWLNAFEGWLAMAEFEMGGLLADTNRNRFLLKLLGSEGKRLLDWDASVMEMEVNTATHANFRLTIWLCLQLLNAPATTASTSGRPLLGDLSPVLCRRRCKRRTAGLVGEMKGIAVTHLQLARAWVVGRSATSPGVLRV